jgi:3-oxoacyl-(acyl-carrier-protein) synthase
VKSESAQVAVPVTGLGVVSCLGTGVETFWRRVAAGDTAIREGLGRVAVTDSDSGRALGFSLTAAREAMNQAGMSQLTADDGFILATTTGQIDVWSKEFVDFLIQKSSRESLEPVFRYQSLGALLDSLRKELGHPSRSTLVTSACSASTQAIALGAMWIRQGRVKRCLVGGVEILTTLTVEGFKSLQLLSNDPSTPFDVNRKGINLSEGAGFLVLGGDSESLCQITGYGLSTDAFHMTGPHPEGAGSFAAMSSALAKANLKPSDISWVHAHGTGSQLNDLSEGLAISRLFGATTPVTSTKYSHGHALGASGAIESVLCVEALRRQTALKTAGLSKVDPKINVNVNFSTPLALKHVLKNTLGFGGVNAAVVFSKVGPS